eukprot:scaffold30792_cov63-Phaeocystis_antarctica.AAC.9
MGDDEPTRRWEPRGGLRGEKQLEGHVNLLRVVTHGQLTPRGRTPLPFRPVPTGEHLSAPQLCRFEYGCIGCEYVVLKAR